MTDSIVVVGQSAGDDYSTIAAAEAAVPADLTLTGGNYIIQIRGDQLYDRIVAPIITDNATHRLIYECFTGEEVNGKGIGAGVVYNGSQYAAAVILRNTHDTVRKLRLEHAKTSSPATAMSIANNLEVSIEDCFIKSGYYGFSLPNSWSGSLNISNTIIAECGNSNLAVGSIAGVVTLDRVTSVKSGKHGFEGNQYGGGDVIATNSIGIGNSSADFESSSDTIQGSFNASGDTSAKGSNVLFNRVITDDLENPNGAIPDYNLKLTSNLIGAGVGGSNVGAILGVEVSDTIETYTFSATINTTPIINGLKSKKINVLGELIQKINLPTGIYKNNNVNSLLEQKHKLHSLANKKVNVSSLLRQNVQQQALTSKKINVSAELQQSFVMSGYFSNSLIEVHQFNATITINPSNKAVLNKKVNQSDQINQSTELPAVTKKAAVLQSNCYYQTELKSQITKQVNIIGNINQRNELSALFFNAAQPIHLRQFRINGEIVFQRFNGAIVSQRFNGVLT